MRRSHRTSDRKCRPSSRHAPASHDINSQSCGPDFDGEITFAARETYTMIYQYRGLTLQRDRMYRSDQENRPEETQRSYETDSLHSKSYVCFTGRTPFGRLELFKTYVFLILYLSFPLALDGILILMLNMMTLVLLLGHSGPSPNTLATSQIHPVSLLVGGIPLYPASLTLCSLCPAVMYGKA